VVTASAIPRIALVAVKDPASRRLLCRLLRDVGGDDVTDVEDRDHALLQLRHGVKAFQLICCDTLGGDGHVEILKFVRWQTTLTLPRSLPVICIRDQWTGEQLTEARDAGASAMLSWPLPRHGLQVALTSVMSSAKRFVESATFRGPCRRVAKISSYKGPFRRSEDAQVQPSAAPPPAPTPAARARPLAERTASVAEEPAVSPLERLMRGEAVQTGIPDIDADHERIREALVRIGHEVSQTATVETIRSKIGALRKLLQQHFVREELIMSSFRYDGMAEHKAAHDQFIGEIERMALELDRDGRPPGMDALSTLAHWLNGHIAEDDIGYVRAMLHGDMAALENPMSRQATIVLHGAFELTAQIDELRAQLAVASGEKSPAVRWLRAKLYDTTEKLANLLMLVPESGKEFALLGETLQSGFRQVRASFFAAAADLAASRVEKIVTEAEDVLKDHGAVPFGISAKLSLRWAAVEALSMIMGGSQAMDDDLKLKFFRARELIGKVTELEGERCQLIDFAGGYEAAVATSAAAPGAEFQVEVLGQLAQKRPD